MAKKPKLARNFVRKGGLPIVACAAVGLMRLIPQMAQVAPLSNTHLNLEWNAQDGSYSIRAEALQRPVLTARVSAEINHRWVRAGDYPGRRATESEFQDVLGKGRQIVATFGGLLDQPDLVLMLRLYADRPFGDVLVEVRNTTAKTITVQAIRPLEAMGRPVLDLGGRASSDRVLSDSFSEDRPVMRIYDLSGRAMHRGVGSQLILCRESGESLFLGALTSDKFLTILHLAVAGAKSPQPEISSFTVDSTGTTEIEREQSLRQSPPEDQIELSLPVAPGKSLGSERLMFEAGRDYHAQLRTYGDVIRVLHHARVSGPHPAGWWSWTAFYGGINEGEVLTNAHWLARRLEGLGYDYFHIDEGYQYARGEYATPNATQFPHGLESVGHELCRLGLKFGIWTAPFEVSSRAWIYVRHRDWLVHDSEGNPIQIGRVGPDRLYVLDATNPGAQQYLRQTYRTLTRDWGVRYIKLDFMDDTAIEGYRHQPNVTALEAQRMGLEVIREAVGDDVLLDKDGSPMLNPVGILDLGRISVDTGHSFEASKDAATGIAARYYMDGNFFVDDPDAFSVSSEILPGQSWHQSPRGISNTDAEVAIVLAALAGGMYEIGDDLPTLGAEKERLGLVENARLLRMVKLGRAATPVDLMTYRPEDEQPSLFFLREDARLAMLAAFNWTDQPRSQRVTREELGLPAGHPLEGVDALHGFRPFAISGDTIEITGLPPHSVRLLELADQTMAPTAPTVKADVPAQAKLGEAVSFVAQGDSSPVPILDYLWDFGDGTGANGAAVTHTYTAAGHYTVVLTADGVDGIRSRLVFPVAAAGHLHSGMDLPANRRYIGPAGP